MRTSSLRRISSGLPRSSDWSTPTSRSASEASSKLGSIVLSVPSSVSSVRDSSSIELGGRSPWWSITSITPAITAGLMMVYAVLVLLFGTFLQPITILFSLQLSIGGAIMALLLTGKQLTTPVWIGILMLMGIVTKNAIMLVEFAVESMRQGRPREVAIIDAGMKRARPIVMTTIAMVAGMLPSALAFGAGGEFRSPMALAVIGGLIFSTVLSLVFVPAMFMLMDDAGRFSWAIGKRILRTNDSTEAPAPPPDQAPPPLPPHGGAAAHGSAQ